MGRAHALTHIFRIHLTILTVAEFRRHKRDRVDEAIAQSGFNEASAHHLAAPRILRKRLHDLGHVAQSFERGVGLERLYGGPQLLAVGARVTAIVPLVFSPGGI